MLADTLRRPPASPWRNRVGRVRTGAWRLGLLALSCSVVLALGAGDALAGQAPVSLGVAGSFAALGGQTVTSTGLTTLNGDLGVSPGSSLTGFPPGKVNGTIHATDPTATQAQADLTAAYNDAAGRQPPQALPLDLGGRTLTPGVYKTGAALALTGTLTLDGQGDPNAVFVIQVGSALTTNVGSDVALINGAKPGNVFWQIGSSVTLGTSSVFAGTILAYTSISIDSAVTLEGRALARNGAVTMIDDTINTPTVRPPPPPPSGGFWFASAGHASFAQAIDQDVREHPADYSKVRQLLEAMLARLAAGRSAGNALPSNPQAARRQVLAALRGLPTRGFAVSAASMPSSFSAASPSASTASTSEHPSKFGKRGRATNARLIWEMPFALNAVHCDESGCFIEEELRAELQVSPGARTTKMNARLTTLDPKHVNVFDNVHFEGYVLCYRSQETCGGPTNSQNFGRSSTITNYLLHSDVLLRGHLVTHAFIFFAHLKPRGPKYYASDKAKTGTASCLKRSNKCRY